MPRPRRAARRWRAARHAALLILLLAAGCSSPEGGREAESEAGPPAPASAPATAGTSLPIPSAALLRDTLWDDGQAEFSVYDGVTRLEGRERSFVAQLIVVKEEFVRDLLVKSDEGPVPGETFEVLKLNFLRDVPTGMYAFHQMTSIFFERESFRLVKFAASSMESCGLTFVVGKPAAGQVELVSHSYWDEEGDRSLVLPWAPGTVTYDALPLWLRGFDLEQPARREAALVATQLSNRVGAPAIAPGTLEFLGPDEGRGGRLAVRVEHAGGEDRLWFDAAPPHVLWRWEQSNGTVLSLRKTQRVAYWKRTAPEDAALLGAPKEVSLP